MSFPFFLFLPILNRKINGSSSASQYHYAHHRNKPFHCHSSLSLGVIKYAKMPNSIIANASKKPDRKENLPDRMLPITPTIKAYLAASANMLATTFLLSTFNYIPKRRRL